MMIADSVCRRLRDAQNIVFFTGAGVSAESGIQTFRASDGLWAGSNPLDVATPQAFRSDPQRVWNFYVDRAETVRKASPNAAHHAIANLSQIVRTQVVTQNVDGLHQRAGSANVLELHGSLHKLKSFIDEDEIFAGGSEPIICAACNGFALPDRCDPYASAEDFAAIQLVAGTVPRCPSCNALLRPNVTWFHEALDPQVISSALEAVEACGAMFCVGASLQVQPAATLPYLALERGAVVVEINPEPAMSRDADACIAGMASKVLPALLRQVWNYQEHSQDAEFAEGGSHLDIS